MKKIALFGGTGKTGSLFLKLAVEAGYELKVLVRNPTKIQLNHPQIQYLNGDIAHYEAVHKVIAGCDLVVSLFGQVKGSPPRIQTLGTQHMIRAMKVEGISRIISLSGGGLPYPEFDQPKWTDRAIRTIMKIVVPEILNDAHLHAEALQESGLDWTIVRGPRLTQEAGRGQYRIGWVGVNSGTKISRHDLAHFILQVVRDHSFSHQMPFVSW